MPTFLQEIKMSNDLTVSEQWQELCSEHDVAKATYLVAFAVVTAKFAAVGRDTFHTNPTDSELAEFDATWKTWQDVKDRMDIFVQKHA